MSIYKQHIKIKLSHMCLSLMRQKTPIFPFYVFIYCIFIYFLFLSGIFLFVKSELQCMSDFTFTFTFFLFLFSMYCIHDFNNK